MPKFFLADDPNETELPLDQVGAYLDQGVDLATDSGEIALTNDSGSRVAVSPEQLRGYLRSGYTIETPEVAQRQAQLQDAAGSPILAGVEAVGRGALLGAPDIIGAAISPEYAREAADRRAALGGVATALEIGGAVVPGLLSGGAGTAGSIARLTPAGALARATELAGRSLESKLVGSGVGAATARLAGLGAEGLADGLVSGVAQQASEDSLGGTPITVERLAAGGGMGALLGLGAGTAVGAGARILSKGARAAADKLSGVDRKLAAEAEQAAAEAAEHGATDAGFFEHVPQGVKDFAAKVGGDLSGKSSDDIARAMNDASARSDSLQIDTIRDRAVRDLQDALQPALDADHLVKDIGAGQTKWEMIQRDVPRGRITAEQARTEALPILQDYKYQLQEALAGSPTIERKAMVKEIEAIEERVANAFATGRKNARGVQELESFKRLLQKRVKKMRPGTGGTTGAVEATGKIQEASNLAQQRLNNLLEDDQILGAFAKNQREMNAVWHRNLQTGKEFNDMLVAKTGAGLEDDDYWYLDRREIDGRKAKAFTGDLTAPERERNIARTRDHLASKLELYKTIDNAGRIPLDMRKEFDAAIAGTERALKVFDETADRLTKAETVNLLAKSDNEAAGLLSPQVGAMVGGFAFGPIGSAAGAMLGTAAQALANPGSLIKKIAQLEAIANRVRGVADTARTRTQSAVATLAKRPRDWDAIRRKAVTTSARSAVRLFGSDRNERLKKAKQIETRLTEYRRDPLRLIDAVGYQSRGMHDAAPRAVQGLAEHAAKSVEFLASKLPPAGPQNILSPGAQLSTWTDQQVDQFSRYVAAINDPMSVVDDLKNGTLSPESLEALQAVYPEMYLEIKQAAIEELAKHGDELPYDSVLQLSLLLGIPGHPSLDPEFMASIQKMWVAESEVEKTVAPSNTKPVPIREQSHIDRIMGGWAT